MTKLRRSFLFVPAHKSDLAAKASKLPADVVVLELEDGVSPEHKSLAREEAGRLLSEVDFANREVALRVNPISTLYGVADLMALAKWPRKPDLVILPKVESAGEVCIYDDLLKEMNASCELMPVVESSRGLKELSSIVMASSRITATSLGGADLSAELGCRYVWEPMLTYRAMVVAAGALVGISAIDPPYLNIKDESGLLEECWRSRDLGFCGKICIHPSQIEAVNRAFSPSPEEVEKAKKIVEAARAQGSGAIVMDGRMVDMAIVKAAQRLVAMADRLGMS